MNTFTPQSAVYAFGSPADQFYGQMVLMPRGRIYGYTHANESSWIAEGGRMWLQNAVGVKTSEFKYSRDFGGFIGHQVGSLHPLCLVPLFRNEVGASLRPLPPILLQTVPKAGTYFLEAVLKHLGWLPSRMHVSPPWFDDYRGLSDDQIHRHPQSVRVKCPLDLVCATLKPGQLAVGHIDDLPLLGRVRQLGVLTLSVIRNLREVIVSMYRFKRDKVSPANFAEGLWRKWGDKGSHFDAFIAVHYESDLAHIARVARTIIADPGAVVVRYEDLVIGGVSDSLGRIMDGIQPNGRHALGVALGLQLNKSTPTFSGCRSNWKQYWTPLAEEMFIASGMRDLNVALGYEEECACTAPMGHVPVESKEQFTEVGAKL